MFVGIIHLFLAMLCVRCLLTTYVEDGQGVVGCVGMELQSPLSGLGAMVEP